MSEHHNLDPYPVTRNEQPLFINEPWIIDRSIIREFVKTNEPEQEEDNRRIYVPLDLNTKATISFGLSVICRKKEGIVWKQLNLCLWASRLTR